MQTPMFTYLKDAIPVDIRTLLCVSYVNKSNGTQCLNVIFEFAHTLFCELAEISGKKVHP